MVEQHAMRRVDVLNVLLRSLPRSQAGCTGGGCGCAAAPTQQTAAVTP